MAIRDIIVSLLMELARVYIIHTYAGIFFEKEYKKREAAACLLSYAMTTSAYLFFHMEVLNVAATLLGTFLIIAMYEGSLKKKLVLTALQLVLSLAIDIFAAFLMMAEASSSNYMLISSFLSVLLLYMAVLVIRRFFAKSDKTEFSGQWYFLIIVCILSICVLYIMTQELFVKQFGVLFICATFFVLNFILYHFYQAMLERFQYEKENQALKMRMNIYENQIRTNIQNDKKVRAIRHDMKHHLREIYALAQQQDAAGVMKYVDKLSGEFADTMPAADTGNATIDGIVNYMYAKACKKQIPFSVKIVIPQELALDVYDMNVILGNVLDNAIENTQAAKQPHIELEMKYVAGVLSIVVSNTCVYGEQSKRTSYQTTKTGDHGYGIDNVKHVVEKYDGTFAIDRETERFQVQIYLHI